MRIKQTTFYAIRMLYRLHREEADVITSKEIAKKEGLSQGVTLKILRELSHAGIVHAYQGRGQKCGGFSLAKSIDEITMAEVVETLEGLDIGANLDGTSREKAKALELACYQINAYLREILSGYSIRYLFEPDEQGSTAATMSSSRESGHMRQIDPKLPPAMHHKQLSQDRRHQ